MRVLISDKFSPRGLEVFQGVKGLRADYKPDLDAEGLLAAIPVYDALAIRSKSKVTAKVLTAGKKLKVVGRAGIGVDNIDLEAATLGGVLVINTPGGNTVTTAEHTLSLLMSLARKVPQATASLKGGKWEKSKFLGTELYNKVLGVVGLGNVGKALAERALGLKMKVIANDPFVSSEGAAALGVQWVSLEDLFAGADFISVHVPKNADTVNLINAAAIRKMKKTAMIINCSRGGIVNETDLHQALVKGRIAGAALDVYDQEPQTKSPLFKLDNVVCTPHLGASTREAQDNVAVAVAEQIVDYLKAGIIRNAVNVPSIDPEKSKVLAPYIALGEKLGRFQSQILEGPPSEIAVIYSGSVAELDTQPITGSVVRGFMVHLDKNANYINAPTLARRRGIRIVESRSQRPGDYSDMITVAVKQGDKATELAGARFGEAGFRIVRIGDYALEAAPEGHMLLIYNEDQPGVVGSVGQLLGKNGINIASLQLGRRKAGGTAALIVNTDSPVPEQLLARLRRRSNILYAKQIEL